MVVLSIVVIAIASTVGQCAHTTIYADIYGVHCHFDPEIATVCHRRCCSRGWDRRCAGSTRAALAVALFEIATTHDRPSGVTGKHPPARFRLVVEVRDEDEARARGRIVEDRLRSPRRVVVDSPRDQHGEDPLAARNRLLDQPAVVRCSRNMGNVDGRSWLISDVSPPDKTNLK